MECAAKGLAGEPCAPGVHRRCGSCGAVAYCSRSHQILHWNVHKDECARLEKQMSRIDILSQFPFIFSTEPPLKHTLPSTRCFFLESIGLHRKGLWNLECICGPAVTSVTDLRVTDEWDLDSSLCPCTEPKNPMSGILTNWEDYYQWRYLPLHSPVALLLHWPLTLYHCLQLSCPQSSTYDGQGTLNIHYLGPEKELLQLVVFGELHALFPGFRLYIELVGPAVPEFSDGETVSIPNYAHCSDESCRCKSSTGSEDASCSTVTVKLRKGLYHDRYSDIVKDSNPHLIIAPNAGVAAYRSWVPTIWSRTTSLQSYQSSPAILFMEACAGIILYLALTSSIILPNAALAELGLMINYNPFYLKELIREIGVPAIFTDFCEEAAHLASCCISSITRQPLRVPIQVNPFRQPMAVDNSALYLPCYSNCFVFGI